MEGHVIQVRVSVELDHKEMGWKYRMDLDGSE